MPQSDQLDKEQQRLSGQAQYPHDKVPTYQELLDAAIEDTFPASDPIAVGGATQIAEPHTTLRDARDWSLKPGSENVPGEAGSRAPSGGPDVSAPCEGFVERAMTLQSSVDAAVEVPRGPCTIEQSEHRAVLRWTADGQPQRGALSIEAYRERLADGSLRRGGPCADPEDIGASS